MARWRVTGLTLVPMFALTATCTELADSETGGTIGSEAVVATEIEELFQERLDELRDELGFIVAGLILEAASGGNYYEEARRRVLDRHDLPRTEEQLGRSFTALAPRHLGEDNAFALPAKTAEDGLMAFNPRTEWTGGGYVFALLLEHR